MKKILLILFLSVSYLSQSQTVNPEVIVSSSGNLSNSYAQISWTLGDFQTRTYKVGDIIMTQGFLQSNLVITNVTTITNNETLDLVVYPNPVKDILNIKLNSDNDLPLRFELYSLEGKLIHSENFNLGSNVSTINFKQFEAGIYILKAISTEKSFVKSYKILYQN